MTEYAQQQKTNNETYQISNKKKKIIVIVGVEINAHREKTKIFIRFVLTMIIKRIKFYHAILQSTSQRSSTKLSNNHRTDLLLITAAFASDGTYT